MLINVETQRVEKSLFVASGFRIHAVSTEDIKRRFSI